MRTKAFYLYNLETGEWGELMFRSGQLEFRPDSIGIYILPRNNIDRIEVDDENIRVVSLHGWEMEGIHEPKLRVMTFRARPSNTMKFEGDNATILAVKKYLASKIGGLVD